MKNKGMLGFDTVQAVIIALLTLAVIVIALFAVLLPMRTAVESIDVQTGTVLNATTTAVVSDAAAGTNLPATVSLRNPVCTVSQCVNSSDGAVVPAVNYTVTNSPGYPCTIRYVGTGATTNGLNNSVWKCTYTYTYDANDTNALVDSTIQSPINFFSNVPTFFTLLGVVVLILIIAIVILTVTRFGGTGETLQEL